MERRLLLVFGLTFLVIILSQPLLNKYLPKPEPEKQSELLGQPSPTPGQPARRGGLPAVAAAPSFAAAAPTKQAAAESEVVIENELYRITFTNRGAQVKSWVLKKYTDDFGKPLDLVNKPGAEKYGYPLSLWTYDETLRNQLNSALYVASESGRKSAPASVSFEYADGDVSVRKSFHFDHSYVVKVETEVVRGSAYVPAYPAWPAGFGDQTHPASYAGGRIDWSNGQEIVRKAPIEGIISKSWVVGGATVPGPLQWAGAVDQYFGAVFLPDNPRQATLVTLHGTIGLPKDLNKPDPQEVEPVSVLGAAVGNPNGPTSARLFAGPKNIDVLAAVQAADGSNLESTLDFGWFGFIAKPLFLWLKWTHEHMVRNWGWAIVVLTVIINLALFPLRLSTMKSAMKMQKLAPQIKAIQEKYKKYKLNDPKRAAQNTELQALYKQHGVNPIGGCFPMLLQMPFLIAFYSMLNNAVELRHAEWLWVRDLAAPDPLHLLPIGIIITMFLIQKLTPQGGMDPVQQRMMMVMMPVMLGVISWSLAAGLGVYWVIGNVIAIVQQLWLNQTAFGREMRAAAEARAAKKR